MGENIAQTSKADEAPTIVPSELTSPVDKQKRPPTSHFTQFPDLPTELRLQIWHHTFPSARNVYIGSPFHNELCMRRSKHADPEALPEPKPFPISMWINQESRTETLKCHFILHPKSVNFHKTIGRSPLCLNPVRDSVYLRYADLHWSTYWRRGWTIEEYFQLLTDHGASHMRKIKCIQIHNVDTTTFILRSSREDFKRTPEELKEECTRIYGALFRHFPALQRIEFKSRDQSSRTKLVLARLATPDLKAWGQKKYWRIVSWSWKHESVITGRERI